MTAFDRLETRLPELMAELAQTSSPDYVNDLLRQTARTRQRPAWSALERWLPMGALARTFLPVRFLPWRPILIAGLLLVLVGAALALYAGSRHPLPPPFGPARNGTILITAADGDILSFDPATGATTPVLADAGVAVTFNSTGSLFYYDATSTGAPEIYVANADGTGSHKAWSGPATTTWIDWSQDGARLLTVVQPPGGGTTVNLVDATTSVATAVHFDKTFLTVAQPYGSHELLLVEEVPGQRSLYYLANDDGTGLRALPTIAAVNLPSLTPDGSRIAYTSWQQGLGLQGRIHVLDLESGADTVVTPDRNDLRLWLDPVFSPDGTRVAAHRFIVGTQDFEIAIVPVDGSAPAVTLGTVHDGSDGAAPFLFSPDGTKVMANYADDGSTWLFDVTRADGQLLAGVPTEFFSWQRVGG